MDISNIFVLLLLPLHPQSGLATENQCLNQEHYEVCLHGGTSKAEGNVFVDGLPVCDDNWVKVNGDVVCKQLGYTRGALRITTESEFGQVGHKFSMDDVQCVGTEDKIKKCTNGSREDCGVMEAAGVVCDDITPQEIAKDQEMTKDCFVKGVSYSSEEARSETKIVSSSMHCQRWCAQTDDCARFTFHTITKTCFQYSLTSQYQKVTANSVVSGPKECLEKNETLENYNTRCNATVCLHSNLNDTDDGDNFEDNSDHAGNVFVNGLPVCDDNWSIAEAGVVCRQLGFHGVRKATKMSHFGLVPSTFAMDDVDCSGNEGNIFNCSYSTLDCYGVEEDIDMECSGAEEYIDNCDSGEGAGVICDTRGEEVINLEKECFIKNLGYSEENKLDLEVTVNYADECQKNCSDHSDCSHFSWFSNNGKCLLLNRTGEDGGKEEHMGAVSGPAVCSPDTPPSFDPSGNCTENDVVCLVGGSSNEGNVFMGGKPVCDDGWNVANAHVVCRQLGFVRALEATIKSHFGEVPQVFGMDNVDCTGQENDLKECAHSSSEDCEGLEAAGVICDPVSVEEHSKMEQDLSEKCFAKNVVYGRPLSNEMMYLPSVSDCQLYCQQDPQCDKFSYNNQTRECNKRATGDQVPTQRNGMCPPGWTTLTTGCYKLTEGGTQQEAATNCMSAGGFLAEIHNQEEHNAVTSFTQEKVWLGATDTAEDGEWVWSHSGQKITFSNWFRGEPNGATRENCLEGNSHGGSTWNDARCSGNFRGLCELGELGDQSWSEAQEKIWNDNQCPNVHFGGFGGLSLDECKKKCLDSPTCTAINYKVRRDCVLRACPSPVPVPQWKHEGYKGYFIQNNKNDKIATVCESKGSRGNGKGSGGNGNMNLNCQNGLIKITSALYGRQDLSTCMLSGVDTSGFDTSCSSDTALLKMKQLCDGKGRCEVAASNGNFGDPCYGTLKYLTVAYSCQELELTGYCLTSSGQDQNDGTQKLNSGSKADCYRQCTAVPQASGCEWHKDGGCIYHTLDVATGNGNSDYRCWVFNSSPGDSCFEFDFHHVGLGLNKPGSVHAPMTDNNYGATGSAKGCQLLCQNTDGCAWFNWVRSPDQCWLKTGKGSRIVQHPGDVTGPRSCVTGEAGSPVRTTSSSVLHEDKKFQWGSQFSIDGLISTHDKLYFHSKKENYPWLQIELSAPTQVSSVTLVNRKDCCFDRLKNVEVRAGMDEVPAGTTGQLLAGNAVCATFQGPPETKQDVSLRCGTPILAKFITIQLKDEMAILQINEFKINKLPDISKLAEDEYFYIESELNGLVLDVKNGGTHQGNTLHMWPKNGSPAQLWRWDGMYLESMLNGLVLDVKGGVTRRGTTVQMWPKNDTPGQKWKYEGKLIWSEVLNDLVLDIRWGGKNQGTSVWIYTANWSKAQLWTLKTSTGRRIHKGGCSFEPIGCWKDTSNRAIPQLEETDASLVGSYKDRQNAVRACYMVAKAKGYPAFAVQDGGWCAGSATALETYKQYGVSSDCRGGKGGPWANNVYQISCQEKRFQSVSSQLISGPSSCFSSPPAFESDACKEPDSVCLVGGSTFEGNIFVGGKPICDDQWNIKNGHIICGQLGLGLAKHVTRSSQFGNVEGPFSMGNVECVGDEERITDCNFVHSPQCLGDEAAGVICETDVEKEVREKKEQMINECFVENICYGTLSHIFFNGRQRRDIFHRLDHFHDHGDLDLTKLRAILKMMGGRNNDIGIKTTTSAEECQKYCETSDSCTHFTFDQNSKQCFKTDSSIKFECINGISGPKSCDKVSTAIRVPKMDSCSLDDQLCLWSKTGKMESAGNVFIGGKPVCDDSWSLVDAEVVCRQLNFHAVRDITTKSHFGYVSGTFSMDNVECTGAENNITGCAHEKKDNCDGSEAAGVICDIREPEVIENERKIIRDCFMEDITFEGAAINSIANVSWAMDCKKYCSNASDCTHFSLHTPSHNCTLYQGEEQGISKKTSFGSYSGPRSCDERANIVKISDGDSNCTGANDLCLRGGSGDGEGNVFWGGKPVCDDKWDLVNANVVCKQLGYSGALEATTKSHFGNVSMMFSLDDVLCRGDEDTLEDCRHTTEENCDGSEAAGVICDSRNETEIEEQDRMATCFAKDIVIGSILEVQRGPIQVQFVYLSSMVDCQKWCHMNELCGYFSFEETSQKCFLHQNIHPYFTKVLSSSKYTQEGFISGPKTCVNVNPDLTNINGEDCSLPGVACLGGGSGAHEGNVFIGGKPICDDIGSWGLTSANVFCKQMGYRKAKDFKTKSHFGPAKGPFFGTNIHCIGSENTISNCLHSPASNCLKMDAVGAVCETFQEWIQEQEPSEASGTCLEKDTRYGGFDDPNGKINGHGEEKATVGDCQAACQDNLECQYFTYFAENRYLSSGNRTAWLCRMLRFKGESQHGRSNYISGPKQCPVCKQYNDEGRCLKYLGKECKEPRAVCLVGGVNATEGNVFVGGKPVCDDEWDKNDADVVCRQLGFLKGAKRYTRQSSFGSVSSSYGMDNVMCTGSEDELKDCQHSSAEDDCGRDEGAGVVCLPNDDDQKCETENDNCCHAVHVVHSDQTVLTNDEHFRPENVFKDDCDEINLESSSKTTFWLAPRGATGELLTVDLGCSKLLEKISMKNTHNDKYNNRGLSNFTISLSNSTEGPWSVVLTDQLPDARYLGCSVALQNFSLNEVDEAVRTGRFVTLNVLTFYGEGAGLQYFNIEGHLKDSSRRGNTLLSIFLVITALLIAALVSFIYHRKEKCRDLSLRFVKSPTKDVVEFNNLVAQISVNSEEIKT